MMINSRSKRSVDDQNNRTSALNQTDIVYYIRLRAFDAEKNGAAWSNIVSAFFLKPEDFEKPVSEMSEGISEL